MSEKLLDILKPQGDCIPEETLVRYADGKLSAAEARKVEEHISECEFCSDALDGIMQNGNIQHFHSQLSSIKKIVHKKVRRSEASETFPIMRTLGVAVTLLVLAISAWYLQYVVNNNSQEIFTHEFAPYPVPQLEKIIPPKSPAIAESKTETQSKRNSSQKNTIANSVAQHEEKKQPAESVENVAPPQTETVGKPNANTTTENDLAITEQANKSAMKVTADSTGTLSSAQYERSEPKPRGVIANESLSTSGDEMIKDEAEEVNHEVVLGNFNKAMSLYQSNRYEEAIAEFQLVLQREPDNPAASFYSGVSSLALKNADEALRFFKKTDYKTCQYYEASLWYEALSYLNKEDKKQAKKLFEKVVELNGEYKGRAEETLKQL